MLHSLAIPHLDSKFSIDYLYRVDKEGNPAPSEEGLSLEWIKVLSEVHVLKNFVTLSIL